MRVETMLRQLVYTSAATKPLREAELERLLELARVRNARDGITGVLLHDELSFLQILEGTTEVVARTIGRVRRDPRHANLTIVQDEAIDERDFGLWDMAYHPVAFPEFKPAMQGHKLERTFIRTLAAQIAQPVVPVIVRRFAGRATR